MANAVEDKKRSGRSDLKALARIAPPVPPPPRRPQMVASADSSGFVDLAAFSADDPNWVERELAKVRTYADESQLAATGPTTRGKMLTPGSLAPLALTALVEKTDDVPVGVRKKKLGKIVFGVTALCAALLAVGFVKHQRDVENAKRAAAAQVAPQPAAPPPTQAAPAIPPPAPVPVATTPATAQAANDTPADAPKPEPAKKGDAKKDKKKPAYAAGGAAPRAQQAAAKAPPPKAQAAKAAPAPAAGGAGSLLDLMKASVAGKKK